jgi:hypothetical protein
MPLRARRPMMLLGAASILLLPGCGILTTERTELSAAAIASAIGHVRPSVRDTCATQVQIAAQSSKIATFQTGQPVVYKPAPQCVVAPSQPAPPKVSQVVPVIEIDADRAQRVASLGRP